MRKQVPLDNSGNVFEEIEVDELKKEHKTMAKEKPVEEKKIEEVSSDAFVDVFKKFVVDRMNESKTGSTRDIGKLRAREEELLGDLKYLERKIFSATIAAEKEKGVLQEEVLKRECQAILDIMGVAEKIGIKDNHLFVITNPIFLSSAEGSGNKFPIGRFSITIGFDGWDVHNIDIGDANCHPHIGENGNICFGNIKGEVTKLIEQYEICSALHVLISFLSTYNKYSKYISPDSIYYNNERVLSKFMKGR
jgi:hypothetical protein